MEKILWILLCMLLALVGINSETTIPVGFPCQNIPNFCDRVDCVPPKDCTNGIIVKGAGNCGCCDACIKYREIGDNCEATPPGHQFDKLPDGDISQYYQYNFCYPGTTCSTSGETSGKCVAPTNEADSTECVYHEYEYISNDWEAQPSCDFYGDYAPKLCKGRSNTRCFCVNQLGETQFGRLPTGTDNATCACSRAVYDTSASTDNVVKMVSYFLRCDETGDYMPLQCWGQVCFCMDPYTRKMTSSAVPLAGIPALPCWDANIYTTTYYTACTSEKLRMNGLAEELAIKGMKIYPLELPNCDPDGTYGFKQFQKNQYFCSDREGVQISSYFTTDYNDYASMICNCARDEAYPDGLPDDQRGRKCNQFGNYGPDYCSQDTCFCLDTDGQQCSGTYVKDKTTLDCVSCVPPTTTLVENKYTESANRMIH